MAKFAQLSDIQADRDFGLAVLQTLLAKSPILRMFDNFNAFELDAQDYDLNPVDQAGRLVARALGGGIIPQSITPVTRLTGALSIMGDAITVDESYMSDHKRGLMNVDNKLNKQFRIRFETFVKEYEKKIFNGTGLEVTNSVGDKEIKGLKTILNGSDDLPGFTGEKGVISAHEYAPGTDPVNFDLTTSSNYKKFLRFFNKMLLQVEDVKAIIMNRDFLSLMTEILHDTRNIQITKDEWGNELFFYNNIPIVVPVEGSILNTEPDAGTGEDIENDTTSFYLVSPAEGNLSIKTNSGLYLRDFSKLPTDKVAHGLAWEIRAQLAIEGKNSIRRVRRVKIA